MTYYRRSIPRTLLAIAPKDPQVKTVLLKGIKDEEAGVRVCSAWALWQLGIRTPNLKEVWSKAQRDDDPVVRKIVGVLTARLARESRYEKPMLSHLAIPERIPSRLRLQPVEHDRNHAHVDHRLARFGSALVVPAVPPEPQQPAERPLHHPALRQQQPAPRPLRPPHDLQPVAAPLRDLGEQRLGGVGRVGPDDPQPRQLVHRHAADDVHRRPGI